MNMVKSITGRILRSLKNYKEANDSLQDQLLSVIKLQQGEQLYGVYYNAPYKLNDCIVTTDKGLHIIYEDGEYFFLNFSDFKDLKLPPKDPEEITLMVYLEDGSSLPLYIKYVKDNKFKDVYEFSRYLRRVTSYIKGQ